MLRGEGHPRRPPRRRTSRRPPLRARLRVPLPRRGDRRFRGELPPRPHAGAVRALQPARKVRRSPRRGARPRRRRARHRPLRPPPRRPARPGTASRRGRASRPELLPVRHRGRAAFVPAVSAGRNDEGGNPRRRRALTPARRRQAGQPGPVFRAPGRPCGAHRTAAPRQPGTRPHRARRRNVRRDA